MEGILGKGLYSSGKTAKVTSAHFITFSSYFFFFIDQVLGQIFSILSLPNYIFVFSSLSRVIKMVQDPDCRSISSFLINFTFSSYFLSLDSFLSSFF